MVIGRYYRLSKTITEEQAEQIVKELSAREDVKNIDIGIVPMHIRNAPIPGMEKEGYGVGYKYPHDYPNHWVEQQYLPDKMLGTKYYIKDDTVED